MTNLSQMKQNFKDQIDKMSIRQFFNVLQSFEDLATYDEFKAVYGLDMSEFYGCDQCNEAHQGCSVPDGIQAGDEYEYCYKRFSEFAEMEV